jgi:protein-disulfide isomerase
MFSFRSGALSPALWGLMALLLVACGGGKREAKEPAPIVIRAVPEAGAESEAPAAPVVVESSQGVAQPSSDSVPIDSDDIVWGAPNAPVTIVQLQDLECPFCARVQPTLAQLEARYPAGQLRFVFKHNPLPFHKQAHEGARFAQAVHVLAGPVAARGFIDLAFRNFRALGTEAYRRFSTELGLDASRVQERASSKDVHASVERDIAFAKNTGLTGTPAFLVNGVRISGAQPLDKFTEVVDTEMKAASALAQENVPPAEVYATRVEKNFVAKAAAADAAPADAAPDLTAWKVAAAGAPSLGPKDAIVTVVAFYDYQCPFCKRVQKTVADLLALYPADVRLVVRQNPLPFHKRAIHASMLALEARAQRGDKGFFEMQQRLFDRAPTFEDKDLLELAAEQKLDVARARRAIDKSVHKRTMEADVELANDVQARGVPHFFVNGVRLSGAQPLEKFVEAVDRERARALEVVKRGVPRSRVYAELQKDAKSPPPPESKLVAPGIASPARGPAGARYVVEIFSDFECPFCKRVLPTLQALEAAHPGQIRWVFRNLPLPFHRNARAAAKLALEARAQKGDRAFWTMHDALFEAQGKDQGLKEEVLLDLAAQQGLDLDKVRAALGGTTHDAAIDADVSAANAAGINGTPSFTVNGFFISGAQPIAAFERLFRYSKAHPSVKAPAKPAPKTP